MENIQCWTFWFYTKNLPAKIFPCLWLIFLHRFFGRAHIYLNIVKKKQQYQTKAEVFPHQYVQNVNMKENLKATPDGTCEGTTPVRWKLYFSPGRTPKPSELISATANVDLNFT